MGEEEEGGGGRERKGRGGGKEKKRKSIQNGKVEIKSSLFTDNMNIYIQKSDIFKKVTRGLPWWRSG